MRGREGDLEVSEYERKLQNATDELVKAGLWRYGKLPFSFRVARKLGFHPKPYWYQSVSENFIFFAFIFAAFPIVLKIFTGQGLGVYFLWPVLALHAGASVFAGLLFSALIRWNCRRKKLSRWQEF